MDEAVQAKNRFDEEFEAIGIQVHQLMESMKKQNNLEIHEWIRLEEAMNQFFIQVMDHGIKQEFEDKFKQIKDLVDLLRGRLS